MKSIVLVLLTAGFFLAPMKALAEDEYVVEEQVKPEVEEVWDAGMKSTFKILSKVGKMNVMTPKQENPAPAPVQADKDRGFIPFSRSYLKMTYYNYNPTPSEIKFDSIKAFGTPGEFEPLTVGVFPLENSSLAYSVTDLAGKAGKIGKENITMCVVKHLLKQYSGGLFEVRPEMIKNENPAVLRKGITKTIWLTVKVPADAKEGIYEGEIILKAGAKPAFKTKISFEVLPITLLINPDCSIGWYSMPMDDNLMKIAVEHGCNAVDSGLAPAMDFKGSSPKLDFTVPNKRAAQIKNLGLTAYVHQIFPLQYANEFINGPKKIPEFSPEFNTLYKQVVGEIVGWLKENKIKAALWLVDEPREDALNPWNRHLAETLRYIKLAHEVPGAVALVDPGSDESFGKDYTVFADQLDVLATHSWSGSKKMMTKCLNGAHAELWLYNCGRTRISFGFNAWKWKAKGRWEWAYDCGWTEKVSLDYQSWSTYGGGDPACGITYPTKNGPIMTPSYEMCREGVDDYKYIYTLDQAIKAAAKSAKPEAAAEAKKARAMLDQMEKQTPDYPDDFFVTYKDKGEALLDEWRYKVAQEIVALNKILK